MASDLAPLPADIEALGKTVVDAAYHVHASLGPGLLESAYEHCLIYELTARGKSIQRQLAMPITFRGAHIDAAYRIDLMVDATIIVEIKAVDTVLPVHRAQLITYLRLSKLRLGYLINFNVVSFGQGIQRFIL